MTESPGQKRNDKINRCDGLNLCFHDKYQFKSYLLFSIAGIVSNAVGAASK